MPIDVTLTCSHPGKVFEALKKCSTFPPTVFSVETQEDCVSINVRSALLLEDLYGDPHTPTDADADLWSKVGSPEVLFEKDLGPLEYTNYVGNWNLQFLGWLKGVSLAARERVEINYLHERGDYPYEYAWWSFDPEAPEGVIEMFGIQSHDGMSDPEWKREVLRHTDGSLEVRVNDLQPDA